MVTFFVTSLFILVLFSNAVTHIEAYPFTPSPHPNSTTAASTASAPSCGFHGNPDIYGPGIRIGIYTQTLAVFITKYFALSDAHSLRDAITVFSIALLSVSIVLAINSPITFAVEFFIVVQILSWNCLTGVRARSTYTSTTFKNRTFRVLFTEGLNIAALVMHMWFWFRGMDGMKNTPCGTKVFFFAKVDMEGWFRQLMKGVAILGLLDHGWDFLGRGLTAWGRGTWREKDDDMNRAVKDFEEVRMKIGRERQEGPIMQTKKETPSVLAGDTRPTLGDHAAPELVGTSTSKLDQQKLKKSTSQSSIEKLSKTDTTNVSTALSMSHSSSTGTDNENHPVPSSSPEHPIALFEAIYNSELFLNHCTAATSSTQLHFRTHHPAIHRILLLLCVIPRPNLTATTNPAVSPPYATCLKKLFVSILTLHFPRHTAILLTHIYRSRSLDPFTAPSQLYTALTYAPNTTPSPSIMLNTPLPKHQHLDVASQIQLLSLSPLPARVKYMQASIDFAIHLFVVLQMELTLSWNGVTSLGRLDNVGQLVPFLVGLGGLLLVLGRWREGRKTGEDRLKRNGFGDGDRIGKGEIDKFVRIYEEWKREIKTGEQVESGV
jgi:hypothetical protein